MNGASELAATFEARPVLGKQWLWEVWDVSHASEGNHFPVLRVDSKGASHDFHRDYAFVCAEALNNRTPAPATTASEGVDDWWKPEPGDPFWMLEVTHGSEMGAWLRNKHSYATTRDPKKALRYPSQWTADIERRGLGGNQDGRFKPTEHTWIALAPAQSDAGLRDGRLRGTEPAAVCVLGGRFDTGAGEWFFAVTMTPLGTSFTHWWPLPDLAAALASPPEADVVRSVGEKLWSVWEQADENHRAHSDMGDREQDIRFLALGLTGEAGELANFIKKRWRDGDSHTDAIGKEIADVCAYAFMLANVMGLSPGELLDIMAEKQRVFVEKMKVRAPTTPSDGGEG